jgi:hypothetical protein
MSLQLIASILTSAILFAQLHTLVHMESIFSLEFYSAWKSSMLPSLNTIQTR